MTIRKAIDLIGQLKPNTYTDEEKVRWLSYLDEIVKESVIDTHEGGEDVVMNPYTTADMDKELLIKSPYDEIYIKWLEAQMDYYNGEPARYNNSIAVFNDTYATFKAAYNRKHMPKATHIKYF